MAEAHGIQIAFESQESRRYWHLQQNVFAWRTARLPGFRFSQWGWQFLVSEQQSNGAWPVSAARSQKRQRIEEREAAAD